MVKLYATPQLPGNLPRKQNDDTILDAEHKPEVQGTMDKYLFSIRQEILIDKGAAILAGFFHYARDYNIPLEDKQNPINIMYGLVWDAKHNILLASTENDLDKIEAQFDFARRFYKEISGCWKKVVSMPTIMEQLIQDAEARGEARARARIQEQARDDFVNDIVSLISDMHLSVSKSIAVLDSLGWSDEDKNKLITRLAQIGYIENLHDWLHQ